MFTPDTYLDEAAMLGRMAALAAADGRTDLVAEFNATADRDREIARQLRAADQRDASDEDVDAALARVNDLELQRERDLIASALPDLPLA